MENRKSDREVDIDYRAFVLGVKRHLKNISLSETIIDNAVNSTKLYERYFNDYESFEKLGVETVALIVFKSYVSIYEKPYKVLKDMLIDMLVSVDSIGRNTAGQYIEDFRLWTKYLETPRGYSMDRVHLQVLVFDILVHHEHKSLGISETLDRWNEKLGGKGYGE